MHYYPGVSAHAAAFSAKNIEGIISSRVPIYYTWRVSLSRERERERDNCWQNALSEGNWTLHLLITSREHKPIYHSAPMIWNWLGLTSAGCWEGVIHVVLRRAGAWWDRTVNFWMPTPQTEGVVPSAGRSMPRRLARGGGFADEECRTRNGCTCWKTVNKCVFK